MNFFCKSLIISFLAWFMVACGSTQVANHALIEQMAVEQMRGTGTDIAQKLEQVNARFEQARADNLPDYAPLHFAYAEQALQEAKKHSDSDKEKDREKAILQLFRADLFLAKAEESGELVRDILADSLAHKQVLLALKADTLHARAYRRVDNGLTALAELIEAGDTEKAREEQGSLLSRMHRLEVQTLKTVYMQPVEDRLRDARTDNNAHRLAEVTYADAQAAIDKANQFIENNPRDIDGIKLISDKAGHAVMRSYHVATEVDKLLGADEETAEQYVLFVESLFERINASVGIEVLSAMPLKGQAKALAAALGAEEDGEVGGKEQGEIPDEERETASP